MKLLVSAAAALAFAASAAHAGPSAKFSANWAADTVTLVQLEQIGAGSNDCNVVDPGDICLGATEILATIKVPQQKELLIGVSGVANLVTFTQAKGKNGQGATTSVAEGTLMLEVKVGQSSDPCADGATAAPGPLTFASRRQELSVDVDLTGYDLEGYELLIEGDVTVALGLDTTATHHSNFVLADLEAGEYNVAACFNATGFVENTGTDLDAETIARTKVAIANRIITVQEVRAVKDSILNF